MAWFVKTTLGNMTQSTKHATYLQALDALHSLKDTYKDNPTENVSIELIFRVGPQARTAARDK